MKKRKNPMKFNSENLRRWLIITIPKEYPFIDIYKIIDNLQDFFNILINKYHENYGILKLNLMNILYSWDTINLSTQTKQEKISKLKEKIDEQYSRYLYKLINDAS